MKKLSHRHAVIAGLAAVVFITAISGASDVDARASAASFVPDSLMQLYLKYLGPSGNSSSVMSGKSVSSSSMSLTSSSIPMKAYDLGPIPSSSSPISAVSSSPHMVRRCSEIDTNKNDNVGGGGNRIWYINEQGQSVGSPQESYEQCNSDGHSLFEEYCIPHEHYKCWNAYYHNLLASEGGGGEVVEADAQNDGYAKIWEPCKAPTPDCPNMCFTSIADCPQTPASPPAYQGECYAVTDGEGYVAGNGLKNPGSDPRSGICTDDEDDSGITDAKVGSSSSFVVPTYPTIVTPSIVPTITVPGYPLNVAYPISPEFPTNTVPPKPIEPIHIEETKIPDHYAPPVIEPCQQNFQKSIYP